MITDNQARKLMKYLQEKRSLGLAAIKSGMSEKTARKYRDLGKLPSELKAEHIRTWRTREDQFEGIWVSMVNKNDPLSDNTFDPLKVKNCVL